MVMHARKQPRLSDGYADRKDAHLHQDLQYHSGVFADSSDDNGPIGGRISPRYQNKSSYIERNKEKRGSLSLAEKKVSHYLATGSLGRPIMDTSFPMGGDQPPVEQPHRSSSSQHHMGQVRKERSGGQGDRGGNSRDYNTHHTPSKVHGSDHKNPPSSSSSLHQHEQVHVKAASGAYHHHQHHHHHHHHTLDQNSHHEKDSSKTVAPNNGKQSSGKDKEQVQKSAIRVCGDWSEHISSSGKRYYYNCKSEVSQWEKPKEWNSEMCKTPDHRSKDGKPRTVSHTSSNKVNPESRSSRHSISGEQHNDHLRSHRVNSMDISESSRDSFYLRDGPSVARDNSRDSSTGAALREQHHKSFADKSRQGECSVNTSNNSIHQGPSGRSAPSSGNNGLPIDQDFKREGLQNAMDIKKGVEGQRRRRTDSQGSQRFQDTGQGTLEAMDISPSSSPSTSRPSSSNGTPQMPASSTPAATASTPGAAHMAPTGPSGAPRSASPQGNPIPTLVNRQTVKEGGGSGNFDKSKSINAIQTLQELHKALSMHIHMAQQSTSTTRPQSVQPSLRHGLSLPLPTPHPHGQAPMFHPASSSQAVTHPSLVPSSTFSGPGLHHTHPPMAAVANQPEEDGLGGRNSPVSETSTRSSCGSPTPSDTSSQNANINQQAMTAAAMKQEETAKLTASLSNYYNEELIGHVLGWQADIVEKQAAKLWEESMSSGSLQCAEVSVQLKRARSQVRIAEIQSTLHEQRIMSSDQQRQEIENMKTPSNFLPS